MELKANPSKILMSDALKGQLPDFEDEKVARMSEQYVHVIIDRWVADKPVPLVGLLRSVLFDTEPELDVKVDLIEALEVVKSTDLMIKGFELQHGADTTISVPGPFSVKAARIDNIDAMTSTCILMLQLQRR